MPAAAAQTKPQSDRDILTALNTDYINSVQHSDVKRFDEILSDDFHCSNPDGSLVDRAAFLKQTAKPVAIRNLKRRGCNRPHHRRLRGDPCAHRLHQAGRHAGRRPIHRWLHEDRRTMACGVCARHAALNAPFAVTRSFPSPACGRGSPRSGGERALTFSRPSPASRQALGTLSPLRGERVKKARG